LTRAICATSTHIIVLANLGRQLLVDIYGVDQSKISVVHHGVPDVAYTHTLSNSKTQLGFEPDVPIIATFGLLSRNKNIQFALKALPTVVKSVPNALYLILGQTHPTVKSYEGESYRQELENNITSLGLSRNVRFVNKFLDDNELVEYLNAVDIYLTPYAHEDQYVSGTLSWAVGLGKAVVSTPYLYAKELLSDGRGFLVPFQDDQFLGTILTTLLKDDQMRNRARRSAYRYGRQMTWSNIADKHEYIFREVILFS
jgi:glycosyltransferase involved in cell wall biosynthesis